MDTAMCVGANVFQFSNNHLGMFLKSNGLFKLKTASVCVCARTHMHAPVYIG